MYNISQKNFKGLMGLCTIGLSVGALKLIENDITLRGFFGLDNGRCRDFYSGLRERVNTMNLYCRIVDAGVPPHFARKIGTEYEKKVFNGTKKSKKDYMTSHSS